jgi:D-methionine transport system substrate-binding protein
MLAGLSLLALTACGGSSSADKTITVAASSTPHAEILEQCIPVLSEQGYTLEIKVMDDYIIPNTSTESGDVDANYFQHQPYLDDFNASNGTHLVTVTRVHYEPYGIYAGTCDSLDALEDGASVAVPNDTTNEARALLLLQDNGIIKLKDGVGLTATKNDIVENPKNVDILEMEAALLPAQLDEVAIAVINGNYAIEGGLHVSGALAVEANDGLAATTYGNIIATSPAKAEDPALKTLVEVLQGPEIKAFIEGKPDGAVVPPN